MSLDQWTIPIALGVGSLALITYVIGNRREADNNPPGPPAFPIFGNALGWPAKESWKVFFEWSKQYGDLVYTTVFTRRIVIINSTDAVQDLLDKRAATYSHRPYLYLYEVSNRQLGVFNITTEHERFRLYRKLLHSELGPRSIGNYSELLRRQTLLMLKRIALEPEGFYDFIRMNTGSTVLRLTYGYDTLEKDDPLILQSDRALSANTQATAIWLADYYPILRKLPVWLAPWKRKGIEIGRQIENFGNVPTNWFRERLAANEYKDCFMSRQWFAAGDEEQRDIIKQVAIAIYAGGVDTVSSAITSFILLMLLHPDVQTKAQAELDAQIGRNRLPNETDYSRTDLPYTIAVIKETLRWAPRRPTRQVLFCIGLPHCAKIDDEYRGYHIKKGTFMIPNIWGMMHDENIYPEPFKFKPERHLGLAPQLDPIPFVFGFGKRVCPGSHFAQLQFFMNVASLLSAFKISKVLDENGQEVEPKISWRTNTVARLEPFPCMFELRQNGDHLLDGPTAW